jgi:hypothetical protein
MVYTRTAEDMLKAMEIKKVLRPMLATATEGLVPLRECRG